MYRKLTQSIMLAALLLGGPFCAQVGLHSPLSAVARADDDNSDDSGGGTLSPDLQWRLAAAAWDKREYDDAAVLGLAYADANPDEPNALEAIWRAYNVYHAYRPNADKAKDDAAKLAAAAARWVTKNQGSNKERAAQAMWYQAMLLDSQGQRDAAIATFQSLTKKFPGTSREQDGWWYPAEWMFQAQRWSDAIPEYEGYRKCVGITEYAGLSCFREAICYEGLKDKANAIETYKIVFDPKYNWGWWQLTYGALDASRRLLVDGAPDVSRKMAMMIIDHAPKDWTDIQNQAHILVGDGPAKNLFMQPYMFNHYQTSRQNIEGTTKLTLSPEPRLLVSVRYASKTDPMHAVLTFTPKVPMKTVPAEVTKVDGDKPSYTLNIDSPDKDGNLYGDRWIGWMEDDRQVSPPADLVLTRKWEKAGPDWGNCTIRLQSSARWHMWIYLPNNQTNPNNINIQPNEVNDGGKTFRYYDWYDLTQGMTIKFPVQVGTSVTEYYPKIRLERNLGRGPDVNSTGTEARDNVDEYSITIKSDKPFPSSFNHPVNEVLFMDEISK